MTQKLKLISVIFVAAISLAAIFTGQPAYAKGETWELTDPTTIKVSGGLFSGPVIMNINGKNITTSNPASITLKPRDGTGKTSPSIWIATTEFNLGSLQNDNPIEEQSRPKGTFCVELANFPDLVDYQTIASAKPINREDCNKTGNGIRYIIPASITNPSLQCSSGLFGWSSWRCNTLWNTDTGLDGNVKIKYSIPGNQPRCGDPGFKGPCALAYDPVTADCSKTNGNPGEGTKCEAIKACMLTSGKTAVECTTGWTTCVNSYLDNKVDISYNTCKNAVSIGDFIGGLSVKEFSKTPTSDTCNVGPMSWIICPAMTMLGTVTDNLFDTLANYFLSVDSSTVQSGNATQGAWTVMRDFANVAFVIVFLIIIFSQLTSVGIGNYGVKKMLPRLIIAAILVNLSYLICQIAVDLSNILGFSLKQVFDSLTSTMKLKDGSLGGYQGNGFGVAGLVVLGVGAGIGALFALTVPVILAVVVALLVIIFILIARKALIIILIVIAPLAFVAFLLPNTEQWYKKWQKLFLSLLMLFPIISVVFGASKLASNILLQASSDNITKIIAVAVATVPFFLVPSLLKSAMNETGALGAKLSAASSKASGRVTSTARGNLGDRYKSSAFGRGQAARKQGKEEFRNRSFTNAAAGDDTSLRGRLRERASRGITGRTFTESGEFAQNRAEGAARGASARAEAKDYSEAVEAATAAQRNFTVDEVSTIAATGMHNGQRVTEHQRAAAIDRTMSSGGFRQRRAVLEGLAADKQNTTRELRNRAVSAAYSKNDQNILGAGFGDQILEEYQPEVRDAAGNITVAARGTINGAADLAAATVKNAREGNVAAEHLVQNSSATEYLVGATITSGDTVARANLAEARDTARTTATTQGKIGPVIGSQLNKL